jgi:hypothetical protein
MKIDRIYRIDQDFVIDINPDQSCKSCLFSGEEKEKICSKA